MKSKRRAIRQAKGGIIFYRGPFSRRPSFFSGPLIILFKEISQPGRGNPDWGQILIVDLDIRFLILQVNKNSPIGKKY
jgi:hypothetical protein